MVTNTLLSLISSWKGLEAFFRVDSEFGFKIYHESLLNSSKFFSKKSVLTLIKRIEEISKVKMLKNEDFVFPTPENIVVDTILFSFSVTQLVKTVFIGLEISSTKDFIDANILGLPLDVEKIFSVHEHEPEFIAETLEEINPDAIVFVGNELEKRSRLMEKTAFFLANTDFIRNSEMTVFYLASDFSMEVVRKYFAIYSNFFSFSQKI